MIDKYTTNIKKKPATHIAKDLLITEYNNQFVQPQKNKKQPRTSITREAIAQYTYTESRTYRLIIEDHKGYSINIAKYNPNNTAWKPK